MKLFLIVIPACALLMTWASGAESRKWTSSSGSVIEGKLVELKPDLSRMVNAKISIETLDGRTVTVAFHQLSAADQAWLANHHGDELAGKAAQKPEVNPPTDIQARLLPMEQAVFFEPEKLLALPAGMSFKREEIPSRGEYEDRASDAVNLVTNHLFWLCKAGCTQIEPGRDENDTWQKLHRKVSIRFRGGKSWEIKSVAALATEMIQREGKGVVSIRPWRASMITPAALDAMEGNPAMILFDCRAQRGDKHEWSLVLPVIESSGRNVTFFYQGERIRARLDDRKPDPSLSIVTLPDGGKHYGYQFVFDPGDSSRLASRLREEKLDITVSTGSFYVIELGLALPAKATP